MSEDRKQKIEEHIQCDPFASFLGANVEILKPGHSRATLTVTDDMVNFHGQHSRRRDFCAWRHGLCLRLVSSHGTKRQWHLTLGLIS